MLVLSALSSTAGQSVLLLFILGVLVQSFDALYFPAQVLRHGDLTARSVDMLNQFYILLMFIGFCVMVLKIPLISSYIVQHVLSLCLLSY